ncbi:MAG: hypothetical protein ACRD1E_11100 [Terriglobales bacterium]
MSTTTPPALAAPPLFRPSAAQRRLLQHIDDNPSFRTVQELCAAAGVPRSSYYDWCKNPAFRLWLGSSWSARLVCGGVTLLNIAPWNCPKSFSYWKALFDLTFDPKGLGLLAKWTESLGELNNAAFESAPPPHGQPPSRPEPAPDPGTRVQEILQSTQTLAAQIRTNRAPAASKAKIPLPHHTARLFTRLCRAHSSRPARRGTLEVPRAERAPVAGERSHDSERPQGATQVRGGVSTLRPKPTRIRLDTY